LNLIRSAASVQEISRMSFRKIIPLALLFAAACGGSSSSTPPPPAAPSITQAPADASVAVGGTATFTVTASGTGLSYQWSRNGSQISGATAASYTTPVLTAADDGVTFAVTVTNASGSVTSPAATLHVNWVRIDTQPADATTTVGGTATFTVAASGTTGLSYQWSRNGSQIPGATGASYTTSALTMADDGASFTVSVTNAGGTVTSSAATLHVNWVRIDTQPVDTGATTGGPATITVAASGNGALSYQWKKDGGVLFAATAASFHLDVTLSIDAGSYTCVVTSTLNGTTASVETNAANLVVLVAPQITSQPHATVVAAGTPATFTVTATGADPLSYQWQKAGANIATATAATYTIPAAAAGDAASYRVVVTGTHGAFTSSTTSAAAALTVVVPPTLTPLADRMVAEGGAGFTLTATGTPAAGMPAAIAYQWQKDGANISGATFPSFTLPHPMALADAGVYTLVASTTISGVTASSTVSSNVTMVAKPVITGITTVPNPAEINQGGSFSVTVTATGTAVTYQWLLNGNPIANATGATYSVTNADSPNAGDYTCIVSSTVQGVTASASSAAATVAVLARPQITQQPRDLTVAEGQTGTFTVVVAGSGLNYQWYRGAPPTGTAISGATSPSYTTAPVGLGDQGATFYCIISNGFLPNETSNTVTLTVGPPPSQFDSSVSTLVLGEGAILRWNFTGTATLQQGTGAASGVASGTSLVVYPSATTTYTLKITNDFTQTLQLTIAVQKYTPKNVYVLNMYPVQTQPAGPTPSDSIAHFTLTLHPASGSAPDEYLPGGAVAGATPAQTNPTGKFPIHVVSSPDETRLFVANNGDSSINVFNVGAGGVLTEVANSPFFITNDVQPFASAIDPSGTHLYVGCNGGVRVFTVDPSTGALTADMTHDVAIAGRIQGDVLMHPSGRWLYVADHGHDLIQAFSVDASTGALTLIGTAPSVGGPTGLTFDRAGSRLFSRGVDTTPVPNTTPPATYNAGIHTFAVDAFSGALTATGSYAGYGPPGQFLQTVYQLTNPMPFVLGADVNLHNMAYSKRPGVDALYNSYAQDTTLGTGNGGFSMSALDVSPFGITGDRVENLGSPFNVDAFTRNSEGGSVFADRSGSSVVLTGWISTVLGPNTCVYYPTDPGTGNLLSINGVEILSSVYTLNAANKNYFANQTHGVFTGQLQ
jgi:hypothetical protein